MTEKNELQKLGTTALDEVIDWGAIEPMSVRPSDIDSNDLAGTQDIGRDEIRLPRLAIAQGLSPQMIPGKPEYNENLKMFDLFNDVTGDVYGKGPILVVPVQRHVTRIEFNPDDQRVPIDRNVPAGDPRLKWSRGTAPDGGDEPPRATEFVEFVCLLLRPSHAPEPIVVSIKTTNKYQRKAASDWTTFIMLRAAAIYRGMYSITTGIGTGKTKEGQDTTYGIFIVKNAGFIPTMKLDGTPNPAGRMLLKMAKQFHESLEGKIINIQREAGDDWLQTAAMDAKTEM